MQKIGLQQNLSQTTKLSPTQIQVIRMLELPSIELGKRINEELQEIQWSLGAEYIYHDQFSLRAGYHHESENKGNRKYFTVGGGFRMNVFSLDVGYVISTARSNPLDQTLRFTLAFDMDGIKDLFK